MTEILFAKIKNYFKDVNLKNSSAIVAAFNKNKELKAECEIFLNEHKEYLTINNMVIAVLTNFEFKKCIVCGKNIDYRRSKCKNALFCSSECRRSPEGNAIIAKKREECTLKKYGVKNISKLDEIKNKKRDTFNKHFDTEEKQKDIVNRRISTCLKKYGVKSYTQTDEYLAKTKTTNNKKYGVDFPQQNKEIREKTVNVFLKKYNTDNCRKIAGINEKIKATCIKKYGVDNYTRTPMYKELMKKRDNTRVYELTKAAIFKKFGVDNVFRLESIKEKIKNSCFKRYGTSCYLNSEKHKIEARTILWKNVLKKLTPAHEIISTKEDYINNSTIKLRCKNCGNIFEYSSIPQQYTCNNCNTNVCSTAEISIREYIKFLGFDTLNNKRDIIRRVRT